MADAGGKDVVASTQADGQANSDAWHLYARYDLAILAIQLSFVVPDLARWNLGALSREHAIVGTCL